MPTPSNPGHLTLTLDRAILESPGARHVKRLRIAIWLYLDLLSRLPDGAESLEVDPVELASAMGLPEGTIRSWLGHLRHAHYVTVAKGPRGLHVGIRRLREIPVPKPPRFFTLANLERALGEADRGSGLEAALETYPDPVIQRALAGAMAVPEGEIKKSRIALFLYLAKRYAHEN